MKQIELSSEQQSYNTLYKEADDVYHDIALGFGLSDSAFSILYAICALGDNCLQRDICNTTYTSKQTINSSIKKLEHQGILTMTAGKGRDMHIHLTPAGQTLVVTCIYPVFEIENRAFQTLSPEERSQLLHLTKRYNQALRAQANQLLMKGNGQTHEDSAI